jgi:hypothetical protein
LSGIREIKTKSEIWLEGRAASPYTEQGRHPKNVCGEEVFKRHYFNWKRAFTAAKLAVFIKDIKFGVRFWEN